jgi:hypothetical protein
MENLNAKQAMELGKAFHTMGNQLQDYLFANWKNLEDVQRNRLENLISTIFKHSDDMAVQSTLLVLEEAKTDLEKILSIGKNMKTSVERLASIQAGITLAGAIVGLGSAILTKNPKEISRQINEFASTFTQF